VKRFSEQKVIVGPAKAIRVVWPTELPSEVRRYTSHATKPGFERTLQVVVHGLTLLTALSAISLYATSTSVSSLLLLLCLLMLSLSVLLLLTRVMT
jgi:hypothetical protein